MSVPGRLWYMHRMHHPAKGGGVIPPQPLPSEEWAMFQCERCERFDSRYVTERLPLLCRRCATGARGRGGWRFRL